MSIGQERNAGTMAPWAAGTPLQNGADGGTGATGSPPLALLRRIAGSRPAAAAGERCEMCAEPLAEKHQHVVDTESRALLCTCRPCYLLFTDSGATLRYRSVPERYVSFPGFELGAGQWDELEIPIGLAFFFFNTGMGRTVAFYPGPAGATESELPLGAWDAVLAANPAVSIAAPDTEALLIRAPGPERLGADCHLVPIDACYELVGRLRKVWRGFDGGQDAREALSGFFDHVVRSSKPAPAMVSPGARPVEGGSDGPA
ncbi:DUF5947 family protein [Pseudarthrobacter sp. P1]|uniref:DUF5947 family protein n=1 Tax=Pseudarthrobacter sp. P1 TaxID=3418418 RepID=UPI003CEF16C6